LSILLGQFGLLAPKDFLTHLVFNLLTMSLPNGGSSRNASCTLIRISSFFSTAQTFARHKQWPVSRKS